MAWDFGNIDEKLLLEFLESRRRNFDNLGIPGNGFSYMKIEVIGEGIELDRQLKKRKIGVLW